MGEQQLGNRKTTTGDDFWAATQQHDTVAQTSIGIAEQCHGQIREWRLQGNELGPTV